VYWCSVQICNLWVSSRLGLDEGAVDITAEVKARVASGAIQHGFSGFLIDSCYAASTKVSPSGASESREFSEKKDVHGEDTEITMHIQEGFAMTDGNKLLMVGSQLVTEIRTALEKETGFQVSCGVAHNVRP
jgi:nucleotidyltransferase/DNA polymerase involved in DNA repair